MFLRHPLTAIQATMANSFGYYAFTPYFLIEQKEPFLISIYATFPEITRPIRDMLRSFYDNKAMSSLLYTGIRPPVYTWLLVLLGVYFISTRRYGGALYLLPSTITILICIASPINGLLRYMLPVIMSMPVVLSFCLAFSFKGKEGAVSE